MRHPLIKYALLFTIVHFGLSVVATYGSFTIFAGPSTPSEVFWDHILGILLFPGRLLFEVFANDLSHSIIWISNSLLWGVVLAYCILAWRKFKVE
jgi:hypothetical protein